MSVYSAIHRCFALYNPLYSYRLYLYDSTYFTHG
jgi:hypothetical protein